MSGGMYSLTKYHRFPQPLGNLFARSVKSYAYDHLIINLHAGREGALYRVFPYRRAISIVPNFYVRLMDIFQYLNNNFAVTAGSVNNHNGWSKIKRKKTKT